MKPVSKTASLALVCLMYLLAFGAGFAVFLLLPFTGARIHPLAAVFIADCAATVVIFVFNLVTGNASVYDPYWSVQPLFMLACFYFGAYSGGAGAFSPRQLFALVPLLLWALRLTLNWAAGFEDLSWEDWRYVDFKTRFPKTAQLIVFGGIMMMPTCLVYAGCIPLYFLLIAQESAAAPLSVIFPAAGGAIILAGTALEHFADTQMRAWKNTPERGPCIYTGLWKYCRHPNYLGEMLVWAGVFVSSLPAVPAAGAAGMLLMILLFCCISIPMMEKHILAKSPSYAEYRQKVRNWL